MEDRSLHNNQVRVISDGLQNFIDSMVEEIVLEGKPFDTQKKYLKKFGENEGLDYEQLESNLYTFIDIIENIKITPNKLMEKYAEEKGQDCHISDSMIRYLLCSISQKIRHVVPKLNKVEGIDHLYFFADSSGNAVIPEKWLDAEEFSEGLAAVARSIPGEKYWKYGFIDTTGKTVIPFHWGSAESFSEGLAIVSNGECDYGYIDKTGRLVIPCKYGMAGYFCDGLAPIWDNNVCEGGYIDKTGRIVIHQKEDWNEILEFREGLAPVCNKDDKWGFIDTKGDAIIPFEWKSAGWFGEGYAPVWDNAGRCGYIDKTGRVVISLRDEWVNAGWFSEGMAPIRNKDEKWGYIDKSGRVVIPYQWNDAWYFEDGVAWVKPSRLYRLINRNGKYV